MGKKFLASEFTIQITRKEFEKMIGGLLEIENEYVEEYSKSQSKFYVTFLFPDVRTHGFVVMMVGKKIRLIFYRELNIKFIESETS